MNQVLVTVGTTEFDQLIQAIDNEDFLIELQKLGFQKLLIQRGRGVYQLSVLPVLAVKYDIEVQIFQFDPNLPSIISQSQLMIGHCGAGTILDAITTGTKMIVVVNYTLQGNHQLELANMLEVRKACKISSPEMLITCMRLCYEEDMVKRADFAQFPILQTEKFATSIENMFDFT